MTSGLFQLLGLTETDGQNERPEDAQAFRERFDEALAKVNESFRTASPVAPTSLLDELNAQRDSLIAAYQTVANKFDSDGAQPPDDDANRVLTAAEALGDKSASTAQEAEAARSKWEEVQSLFDDAAAQAAELLDASHPKGETLGKLVETIREKVSMRSFNEAVEAFSQANPKITQLYEEFVAAQQETSEDSPQQTPTAPEVDTSPRIVEGNGGYSYEQHVDGKLFVVGSPNGPQRTQVAPGTPVYEAILKEIGPHPATLQPAPDGSPAKPETGPPVEPSLLEELLGGAQDLVGGIQDAISDVTEGVQDAIAGIGEGIGDFFGGGEESSEGENPEVVLPPESEEVQTIKQLEALLSQEELTSDQIAEARKLIEKAPGEMQGDYYERLQAHAEYYNQRNNDVLEGKHGGTCNLTAVAMALSYLGVSNPHPEMDFDEALVKIAIDKKDKKMSDAEYIKQGTTWKMVARELGVNDIVDVGYDKKEPKSWWESEVNEKYLRKGYGIVMSLRGHVIRLQGMNDAGLIVDDPYGASKLTGRIQTKTETVVDEQGNTTKVTKQLRDKDGLLRPKYDWTGDNNARDGEDGSGAGDDLGYPWADVEKYTFQYLLAFKK